MIYRFVIYYSSALIMQWSFGLSTKLDIYLYFYRANQQNVNPLADGGIEWLWPTFKQWLVSICDQHEINVA